jgi:hypothetical protein
MEKRWVMILFLFWLPCCFCQEPCNNEVIMGVKGKWAKRPDANMKAGNQLPITGRIDKI